MQQNQAGKYNKHKIAAVKLKPLVHAVTLLLATGGAAQAQQAFSPAWFASKGAVQNSASTTGYLPNGTPASALTNPGMQQQQANQQLQTSLNNLALIARGIAAQQAAQEAARQAALANGGSVPDGLVDGGLKVDTNSLTAGWINATAPTQSSANGKTTVAIQQTADKAILNWETFNVGRDTIVRFMQDPNWAVLNRVNDPLARPSQIQGQIKADGTVLIVNRNGIIFSGSSQVDTRNLVVAAAAITDAQFRDKGLYVDAAGSAPSFTDALGQIEVQAGAQLSTAAPTSATQSGGYVLLMGSAVDNAGRINTPSGQVALAAGDNFYIRKGVGTDGNQTSTTRGNEVAAKLNAGSTSSGIASNTGLITASTGDITLTGHQVVQGGVAVSTTSTGTRGTIHLLNGAGDAGGSVTLAAGSTTAILLDPNSGSALDSQRDAALKNLDGVKGTNNITANFDNLSNIADRGDLSRIEIVSGNTIEFQAGSTTLATGGQIASTAKQRSLVGNDAVLDVAGAVGVNVAMASNNLSINVQGNELRDAAGNRDGAQLNSSNVWIDKRTLVLVPAGTDGYATDRWYTAGGLLEVSGYLATSGHSVGEWMALGGTVTFAGKEVVTQARSSINMSGGTLDVQSGYINQTWLKGADGALYEMSKAPGDLLYNGVYKGFEVAHARWGASATEYFYNPFIGPQRRLESGYTVGRDAGRLVIGTTSAVLEGTLTSDVYQGPRQTQAAQASIDGYYQSQTAVARNGQLIVGQYFPVYDTTAGMLRYSLASMANTVSLADGVAALADGLGLGTALPAASVGNIVLDSGSINNAGLGGLLIGAKESITVNGAVQLSNGGNITLYTPQVNVNADLTAHGGVINLGNNLLQMSVNSRYEDSLLQPAAGKSSGVQVAAGVKLDASGLWSNQLAQPADIGSVPFINGGTVSLRSTGDISLGQGGLIDVSSGAALLVSGKSSGGKGGNIALQNNTYLHSGANMTFAGEVRGYGVNGGGTLAIDTGTIVIGGTATPAPGVLQLDEDFFNKGFSNYVLTAAAGMTVADGAQVNVAMPVYRVGANAATVASGANAAQALELWTPPLYQENPLKGKLTQRKGASLALQISDPSNTAALLNSSVLRIGSDASVTVDPGQAITLIGIGQLTVDRGAHLNAWGGRITLGQLQLSDKNPVINSAYTNAPAHSIWIGEDAVLDVAGRAVTALDTNGHTYGMAGAGGSIVIGGSIDPAKGLISTMNLHAFVAVREGALLDASGSAAGIDVPGMGRVNVAGNGGSIALASGDGLYLDGIMRAASGGQGAAGGNLSVALDTPSYVRYPATTGARLNQRDLIVSQTAQPSGLAAGLSATAGTAQMVYGHARLGVDQVQNGGFGQLSLFSGGSLSFDGNVNLSMSQSLQLYSNTIRQTDLGNSANSVNLAAPYVRLAGMGLLLTPDAQMLPTVPAALTRLSTRKELNVSGDLIDVRDMIALGFSLTTLDSTGDLRFLAASSALLNNQQYGTRLDTPGDVTLRAAQIYPDTGATASVEAGLVAGTYDPASIIRIERNGSGLPAMPYSVFGMLRLSSATVEQGGVLRAPLGSLVLGDHYPNTRLIDFLPGSLTSVSAAGLVMPYGGTVDGINYTYNGSAVTLFGVGGARFTNETRLNQGISLASAVVHAQPGAVLDLSGGGDLSGVGFISGRGGSTDARIAPLMQTGADGRLVLPSLASNPIYAIVPGVQAPQAPGATQGGAVDPLIGQQITIGAGVAGLPAGTYTLLPSSYALLPGAFRVELNGAAGLGPAFASAAMRNGSSSVAAQLSIANTGIGDVLFRQAIVTPAQVMRRYSQYNEMSYAEFVVADAARRNVSRAMLPDDGKSLILYLHNGAGVDALQFDGMADFHSTADGYGGSLIVLAYGLGGHPSALEIVAPGAGATPGFDGMSIRSDSLNRFAPARMTIGSIPLSTYGQGGDVIDFGGGFTNNLYLRSGATLRAPEVMLVTAGEDNSHQLVIEQGASINTIGQGKVAYDSSNGYSYSGGVNIVAVSNGVLNFLPPSTRAVKAGGIDIGACAQGSCSGQTELYSEGSIALMTRGSFQLDNAVRYGARNLTLGVSAVNAGSAQALADAAARNALPLGLALNQETLDRLLAGDTRYGAPALETLILSARDSFNFYGTTTLSTLDPATGKSTLKNFVLSTPALYGYGGGADVATIETGNLIWNGALNAAGTVAAQGAGTGSGTLAIRAERIEFGYAQFTQPNSLAVFDRLALGFANVNLNASDRVTANHKGSLSVYQSQGAYDPATGYQYSGGNLSITAPLVTGEAGSVNAIVAGGTLTVTGSGDGAAARPGAPLGAELTLSGHDVHIDGTLALPSGKLTLSAVGDLTLGEHAIIDMAGRKVSFNDVDKYSWGGDLILQSSAGNISQAAGSVIDLSAQNNNAGTLTATALDAAAGTVDLQGSILGSSSGRYDAGGTLVPYLAGSVDIHAQQLGDSGTLDIQFAALNQRLNSGAVFGARSFQLKQGDLIIGSDVKAGEVNVSIDNGSLTVNGVIDASGERVGTIRLAAGNNLTIAGSALLDAHSTTLRVDSYGKIIDSPNRAIVELSSGLTGTLTLATGARIDLRHGTDAAIGVQPGQNDGAARGTLTLNAYRTGEISGDVRIDAAGSLDIRGARSIAVNAMWRYDDAPDGVDPAGNGRPFQIIDQDYLKIKDGQNTLFMTAAQANDNWMSTKLAGLRSYSDAFHLRPGLDIVSKTADGNLVVQGDIDLSGFRYASVNPNTPKTPGVAGSGEVGTLNLRAGGDLNIYGSINDGFAPPPATQDDNGWLLLPGKNFTGDNVVVPRAGVVLADGTIYEPGRTLNYDLPVKANIYPGGLQLPVASVLSAPLTVNAGTVFSANVRDAAGNIIHAAGSILAADEILPTNTRFDAGMRLPANASLAALVWPKNIVLPSPVVPYGTGSLVMNGDTTLPLGGLIPAGTDIKLPGGVASIDLRDGSSGSQGKLWAVAAMLPEGSQSWSLRLVAGADTSAADSRLTMAKAGGGNLRMADSHYGMYIKAYPGTQTITLYGSMYLAGDDSIYGLNASDTAANWFGTTEDDLCSWGGPICGGGTGSPAPGSTRFSVVRTGAADMDLLAAGNFSMDTLYGVYTAGTSSAATGANDPYNLPRARTATGTVLSDGITTNEKFVNGSADNLARAWYPTGGGNLTVKAGGDISGNQIGGVGTYQRPNQDGGYNSGAVGDWLWRQGSGGVLGAGLDQPTAWWINFGSFVSKVPDNYGSADQMVGFTGLGTLGGGNLRLTAGGDAGTQARGIDFAMAYAISPRSQGLVLAVASTGRVGADGSLSLTGGGDMNVRIGGRFNPVDPVTTGMDGALVDLRGNVQVQATALGRMDLVYSNEVSRNAPGETRAYNAFVATRANVGGGLLLVPGDATFSLSTRGDQAVGGVLDPTRTVQANAMPLTAVVADPSDPSKSLPTGSGQSWFSLWTKNTAIDLFSAGGNMTPLGNPGIASDTASMSPGILRAVAASGSMYYGNAANLNYGTGTSPLFPLLLAPSENGQLEFLARDSIYGGLYTVSQSAASSSSMATPFKPAFYGTTAAGTVKTNVSGGDMYMEGSAYPLFAFGPGSVSDEVRGNGQPARFYAVEGDLVGVNSGRVVTFASIDPRPGQIWYEGAQPVWMMAGRDIVSSGSQLGQSDYYSNYGIFYFSGTDNLFVHNKASDISIVSAGRDILYSSFAVAGPGALEITAGRNILMENKVSVTSIGPVVAGDHRAGADIVMQAGVGAAGPDYAALIARYLNPDNLAQTGVALASQPGKVVKTYEQELLVWLSQRYGFSGSVEQALAYYQALPAEQQRVFARQVYFAELTAGGREYNDPNSPRFGSYLRGRNVIASLFPGVDASGNALTYAGDITMYGNAGVHTLFGGDIQMLTPGGRQVFGVEGGNPAGSAGLITQGAGNIQLYALGSILLGQSRIMTTFGGAILGWSAQGDINAGRGSKTTVVFTPPKRIYDRWGNVTLASDVPSTGAGIATLAPIPEVPAGDVDLIAPLGTIDAGEAGIRVSGNVNLAALQVVNAANIQVKGEAVGIPTIAAVNVGALTNASAAASSAAAAAQDAVGRDRAAARQNLPSVFTVRVLGFGSDAAAPPSGTTSSGYKPDGVVQVLGAGALGPAQMQALSPAERKALVR